jgi:hypothetical protein
VLSALRNTLPLQIAEFRATTLRALHIKGNSYSRFVNACEEDDTVRMLTMRQLPSEIRTRLVRQTIKTQKHLLSLVPVFYPSKRCAGFVPNQICQGVIKCMRTISAIQPQSEKQFPDDYFFEWSLPLVER